MIPQRAHRLRWRPRGAPLAASAVLARGPAVAALIARTLGRFEALEILEGVTGHDFIVLLGPEAVLPWVDGARYYGRDPGAPSLYLPTALEPDVSVHLLASALPPLMLVDPDAGELIPLEAALPLSEQKLRDRART